MHPLLMEKSPTGVFSTAAPMPIETYPKTPSGTTAPNSCASLPAEGPMGTGTTPPTSSSPAHQRKQIVMGRTHKNRGQNLLLRFRPPINMEHVYTSIVVILPARIYFIHPLTHVPTVH